MPPSESAPREDIFVIDLIQLPMLCCSRLKNKGTNGTTRPTKQPLGVKKMRGFMVKVLGITLVMVTSLALPTSANAATASEVLQGYEVERVKPIREDCIRMGCVPEDIVGWVPCAYCGCADNMCWLICEVSDCAMADPFPLCIYQGDCYTYCPCPGGDGGGGYEDPWGDKFWWCSNRTPGDLRAKLRRVSG